MIDSREKKRVDRMSLIVQLQYLKQQIMKLPMKSTRIKLKLQNHRRHLQVPIKINAYVKYVHAGTVVRLVKSDKLFF